jgi:glutamyl-tRNA synthetase
VELADWLAMYVAPVKPSESDLAQHVTEAIKPAVAALAVRLATVSWDKASIAQAIKDTLQEAGLKMPQLAIPVRVMVSGRTQTPSVDAMLALFPRQELIARLQVA